MEQFYIPVAMYESGPSLHTGRHGARYYSSEQSAREWRLRHGKVGLWKIAELTIDGDSISVRWID